MKKSFYVPKMWAFLPKCNLHTDIVGWNDIDLLRDKVFNHVDVRNQANHFLTVTQSPQRVEYEDEILPSKLSEAFVDK